MTHRPRPSLLSAAFAFSLLAGPLLLTGSLTARAETAGSAPGASLAKIAAGDVADAPVIGGKVTVATLKNGMKVVVIPDHRAPVVTHMVWYKVGAADEVPGKSGIAHFLEHLMFKGTKTHPAGEFSARVAEIGGQENAFTSNDYTAYYQRVAKPYLGEMMAYEADRMANLVLTDKVVLPERDVILEERNMRIDNDPSAKLSEALDAALYINHPYGKPVIGWRHEMEGLTRQDAIDFYDRYYTPNNAILVVAGDVEPDEVLKLARETYGKLARRAEVPPRVRPHEPAPIAERSVKLADPRVAQPSLRQAWIVPSYHTAKKGEAEALDILSEVLGGGSTSRLYRGLVMSDKPLAASAGGWYQSTALDDTTFAVYAVPRDGEKLDDLKAGVDAIIADIATNGITDEELQRAKRSVVADAIYAQDNQAALARIFGTALTSGSSVEDVQTWPAHIAAVTAKQVQDVARRYLTEKGSVTGELVSAPSDTAAAGMPGAAAKSADAVGTPAPSSRPGTPDEPQS